MYDIKPLEAEWKRYRKKKLMPWYGLLIVIITVLIGFVFYGKKIILPNLNIPFETKVDIETKVDKKDNSNLTVLTPSYLSSEINDIERSSLSSTKFSEGVLNEAKNIPEPLVEIPILDDLPVEKKNVGGSKNYIEIRDTTNSSAYRDVEDRFIQSNNVDDALFLAKSYYKSGNYTKSEFWSLEANKLDPNLEESIFIFVKSKFYNTKIIPRCFKNKLRSGEVFQSREGGAASKEYERGFRTYSL